MEFVPQIKDDSNLEQMCKMLIQNQREMEKEFNKNLKLIQTKQQ